MGDYEEDMLFFKNKCERLEKRVYELVKINEIHQKENGVLRQELKELQTRYKNVERQYLAVTKR